MARLAGILAAVSLLALSPISAEAARFYTVQAVYADDETRRFSNTGKTFIIYPDEKPPTSLDQAKEALQEVLSDPNVASPRTDYQGLGRESSRRGQAARGHLEFR